MDDVKFITIKEKRKVGNIVLNNEIPLPVQFEKGQNPEDLNLASIVAGLIKVAAYEPENEHFDYYKDVLLEMQPNVIEELSKAAIAKSEKKEFDFALELMLAINHITLLPESYVNLAILYAQMTVDYHKNGDDVKADQYDDKIAQVLMDCIEKYPSYGPAYSEISAFHMRHGDMEQARDYLDKFIPLCMDLKEKANAEKTLQKLNKMLSSQDQILYAYDKMMMGCSEDAIETINKYLAGNEPCWEAYFLRGWAYRTQEDFESAQKDLLESVRIDGKNAEVYNELSICARECGNVELAKSYLDIAADLDPENVVYLTNLALLYLSDGMFAESREMIEKARVVDSEDPQLKYIIKEYEDKTGDKLGQVISEEIYTDEDFEELHKKEHEEHKHHEEI